MKGYEFVEREQANHSVQALCRVLGGSPSGYWAWRKRGPSARADDQLTARVVAIHDARRGTYGAPRIHAALAAAGLGCGRKRVARLMRQVGVVGAHRRCPVTTTQRAPGAEAPPDLVQRAFSAPAPDRRSVAAIPYVPPWDGFLSLAVVLDVFSRRVVGWSLADHLRTEVAVNALTMAVSQHRA